MESFAEVWELVKNWILDNDKLSSVAFDLWIKCARGIELRGDTVVLSVPSQFQRDMLVSKFLPIVKEGFSSILGFDVDVVVDIEQEDSSVSIKESNPSNIDIIGEYTFNNFIVGSSNKFAHAAAMSVAKNPSGNYNPLFIYGNSGLGKTHLMYAVCNKIKNDNPSKTIIIIKGEAFANELIEGIKNKNTIDFHDKYRQADVFGVDDIQFIGGKESVQEEFFHTFEALYQSGKQIILTSDRAPREIKQLEERMRSRFEMGLTADIQPPDFETRMAIIQRKSESLGYVIPDEICEYISNKLKNNIRQMEGVVKKIYAQQTFTKRTVSKKEVEEIIRGIMDPDSDSPQVTAEKIIDEVARTFGVSADDILSKKRNAAISNARQISAYVMRQVTQFSMQQIGEFLGGKDHSTMVYSLQKCEKKVAESPQLKSTIQDIINNITHQ